MKERIFTPGPTPLPEKVRLSQAKDIIHHRTPEFSQVFEEVREGLKYVFQTQNDVLILTASGSGAMEATISNLLSPQDKILVTRGGKFGERWGEIGEAFGLNVVPIDVKWGKAVEPEKIEEKLQEDGRIKAVFTQLVETSTGVVNDIKRMGEIVSRTSAILVVDAISGLGAEPLFTDEWKVDVVVAGSQKAFMLPPGLAFVSLSQKAWKMVEESTLPKYYWDLKKAKASLTKGQTPYTPAISLICALRESLRLIREEGWDKILERHRLLAQATRRGVTSLGLEIFADSPSNVVTPVLVPEKIGEKELRKKLQKDYGVTVAGGQGELSGKVIRIAHLGWMDKLDIIGAISALEMSLVELGYEVELGRGVRAAEEVLIRKT
jgi:aspartate aminotransferase-like enzyme